MMYIIKNVIQPTSYTTVLCTSQNACDTANPKKTGVDILMPSLSVRSLIFGNYVFWILSRSETADGG
jgi:hypothetical protein